MFKTVFFEFQRIKSNRKANFMFLLFCAFALYFVYSGVIEYKRFLDEKENFSQYEELKARQFLNYDQYGAHGFRVLFQASPLNIFFNSMAMKRTESNVNTNEIIKVTNSRRGKALFVDKGYFKGFSDFVLFFGSLFMLYVGLTTFKSLKKITFYEKLKGIIKAMATRLLLLELFFILLFVAVFLLVQLLGVGFSNSEIAIYTSFLLYTLFILAFFYISGIMISLLAINHKEVTIPLAMVFWFAFVILVPELANKHISNKARDIQPIEKVYITKLKTLMDFERRASEKFEEISKDPEADPQKIKREIAAEYLDESYKTNEKSENEFINEVKKIISVNQKVSLIFPTIYFSFLENEITSNGYNSYIRFLEYVLETRKNFMKFYLDKRKFSRFTKVEPFVKNDENVFKAAGALPANFGAGLAMTSLYSLLFLALSLGIINSKLKEKAEEAVKFNLKQLDAGKTYFILCKNDFYKNNLFIQLKNGGGALCLDKIRAGDIDPEVAPRNLVSYLCHLRGIKDVEKANENLFKLGVDDIRDRKRRNGLPDEIIRKIYCAVVLASDKETIVLNDFIKGESKKFEQQFIKMLSEYKLENKKILYLSSEMFVPGSYIDDKVQGKEELEIYQIDVEKVSLR